jgi:[ribosomal protein S5]-alanine N-acetyltransferase
MELHTPRLLLREFRKSDWRSVHAYAADLKVTRYTSFGPNTEGLTRTYVGYVLDAAREEPRRSFTLGIVERATGGFLGACGLDLRPPTDRLAELAYILHRPHWGRGYAVEASQALLAFGFDELKLHRIVARCDTRNTGSERVMQKLGMRREGHLREAEWIKERWIDVLLYAILQSEWRAQSLTAP